MQINTVLNCKVSMTEYLHSEMTNIAYPLQRVPQRVPVIQLFPFAWRLFVSSQVTDSLASSGTTDGQQEEDVPRTVFEVAPQAMGCFAFEGCQIDHRPSHQVILVALVAIPDRHFELLAQVWILVKMKIELLQPDWVQSLVHYL